MFRRRASRESPAEESSVPIFRRDSFSCEAAGSATVGESIRVLERSSLDCRARVYSGRGTGTENFFATLLLRRNRSRTPSDGGVQGEEKVGGTRREGGEEQPTFHKGHED